MPTKLSAHLASLSSRSTTHKLWELHIAWRDFLVAQQLINDNYQTRNRQESRVLLLATVQVPADIQDFQFLPDRLKIFVTVGRGGWAAALTALPDLELQQLGVQLPPPAPVLHLPPAPAPSVQYAGSSLISAESQQTIDEIESLPDLHQLLTPSPRPLPLSPSCLPELPDLDSILGRSSSANWPEASTEPSETDSDDEYQGPPTVDTFFSALPAVERRLRSARAAPVASRVPPRQLQLLDRRLQTARTGAVQRAARLNYVVHRYRVTTHLTIVEETVRVWAVRLARRVPDPQQAAEAAELVADGGLLRDFDRPLLDMKRATETLVTDGGISTEEKAAATQFVDKVTAKWQPLSAEVQSLTYILEEMLVDVKKMTPAMTEPETEEQQVAVPEAVLAPVAGPQDGEEDTQSTDLMTDLDGIISQLEGLQERVTGLKQVAEVRQQRNREKKGQRDSMEPVQSPPSETEGLAEPADGWARFSALQQRVQQWLEQHEPLVQQPRVINSLDELNDLLARHQAGVSQCAEIAQHLSEMTALQPSLSPRAAGPSAEKLLRDCQQRKTDTETALRRRVLVLQETLELWRRCELLLSDVEVWCSAAETELGSPAALAGPLRLQLAAVQPLPAEIASRETEVAREAERLMLLFGSEQLSGALTLTSRRAELQQLLSQLHVAAEERCSRLTESLAQLDRHRQVRLSAVPAPGTESAVPVETTTTVVPLKTTPKAVQLKKFKRLGTTIVKKLKKRLRPSPADVKPTESITGEAGHCS
ncbi:Nesprin-1 [Amphibalanus amphitrite]|uniref:Nesprin-1 n=1 Tax=Amphibalanus amphitrite TaxID=1232801 RepID=A0A6A4X699_AMPAM|nr:Nesprin-1 [Amphibalanus amphitrite]